VDGRGRKGSLRRLSDELPRLLKVGLNFKEIKAMPAVSASILPLAASKRVVLKPWAQENRQSSVQACSSSA